MGGFACARAMYSMFLPSRNLFSGRAAFLTSIRSQRREKPIGFVSAIAWANSARTRESSNFCLRRSSGKVMALFHAGISSNRVESLSVQRRIERRVLVMA